jgi:type I restriction enzyme S subunit
MSTEHSFVPLRSLISPVETWSPAREHRNSVEYIDIGSLDRERKAIVGTTRFPPKEAPSRAKYIVRAGDILVSTVRPNLNAVAVVPPSLSGAIASSGFAVLRVDQAKASSDFVFHWVRTKRFVDEMVRQATGASYPAVSAAIVGASLVPQIPLEHQRRIAAILDKADAIRRKRQEAIALTEQLLRSTFLEMFGDPVTNPKGWPEMTLGGVTSVRTGKTPSRDNPANYGGTIPWVKTTEVRGGVILDTEEHLSDEGFRGMEVFPKGSIVIAMYGQGSTRGRVAMLGVDAATNQACAILVPKPQVERAFLWTYLHLSYEPLRDLGRGGNQPNLNLNLVRSFPLPLPPLPLQQEFAALRSRIDLIAGRQSEAAQAGDALFNSLTQRAFSGQL